MNNAEFVIRMLECPFEQDFIYNLQEKKWYTYGQIWRSAIHIADFFREENVSEVAVILENGIKLFTTYFACMLANVVIIPIDPQKSSLEIEHILKNHPSALRITSEDELPEITDDIANYAVIKRKLELVDFEKPYMVTYTSGSTGQAKGVIHSLKNIFLAAIEFGEKIDLDEKYIMCHTMPMTYMAGILNTIFKPFLMHSKIAIFPRFSVMTAISFWKNVRELNINAFWFSPTMLNILLTVDRKGDMKEYFRARETIFCVGTAPLFPQLKEKFETRYGVSLLQSYGLSETLFISTRIPGKIADNNSVGTVLDSVEIQFSENEEILVSVPWMFMGYSNENTSDYFEGQYYLTGDLGENRDNNLFITGRKKDLIIRGGMNISPKQIEEVLLESALVRECAVASVIENNEEYILCWYVLNNHIENVAVALNKIIIERLGKAYKVDQFIAKKELPKNLNGKMDKELLKKEYLDDSKV